MRQAALLALLLGAWLILAHVLRQAARELRRPSQSDQINRRLRPPLPGTPPARVRGWGRLFLSGAGR